MSVSLYSLNDEEKKCANHEVSTVVDYLSSVFDSMAEFEKLGGSAAYLEAIASVSLLLDHVAAQDIEVNELSAFGLYHKNAVPELKINSKWGKIFFEARMEAAKTHHLTGLGLGYSSTDINVGGGTLYYRSWSRVMVADSFKIAGANGYIFIYLSSHDLPAGFIKAKGEFLSVAGKGKCHWDLEAL